MRTTLNLDDDIFRVAKAMARQEEKSLGAIISEFARKGLMAGKRYERTEVDDLPVFQVREDSPVFTSEDVKRDEDGW
ncbi:MAG: antitoxin [Kiritimatiellia bacterium]|jgi:hypothetical protein